MTPAEHFHSLGFALRESRLTSAGYNALLAKVAMCTGIADAAEPGVCAVQSMPDSPYDKIIAILFPHDKLYGFIFSADQQELRLQEAAEDGIVRFPADQPSQRQSWSIRVADDTKLQLGSPSLLERDRLVVERGENGRILLPCSRLQCAVELYQDLIPKDSHENCLRVIDSIAQMYSTDARIGALFPLHGNLEICWRMGSPTGYRRQLHFIIKYLKWLVDGTWSRSSLPEPEIAPHSAAAAVNCINWNYQEELTHLRELLKIATSGLRSRK